MKCNGFPLLFLLFLCLPWLEACRPHDGSQLDAIVSTYELADGPGGAVAVISGDSILFERAFGVRSVDSKERITPTTNFRLASVTKQFTAASILMLRDRGALRLNQPLTDFFPHFASVGRTITIQNLLCHTSGLVAYEDVMSETITVPVLDKDVLSLVQDIDSTYFLPGSRYRYSNTGYALLALIVERTSGKRFADFLKDEIFTPVGMDGSVAYEDGISEVSERAFGHSPNKADTSQYEVTDQSMTSSVLGDGGIYSSIRDLTRWLRSLEDPKIMSRKSLEEAFTPHSASDDGTTRYGYGWMIEDDGGQKALYHTGSTRGFRNAIFRVPEKRIAVIVLMNREDAKAEILARELLADILPSD